MKRWRSSRTRSKSTSDPELSHGNFVAKGLFSRDLSELTPRSNGGLGEGPEGS